MEKDLFGIIYKVINIIDRKIYIGQTISTINKRKQDHFSHARTKKKDKSYFHRLM